MQQAQNYLPTQVNELITVERSFATARLPGSDKKNIAALTKSVRTFSTPFLQPDEFQSEESIALSRGHLRRLFVLLQSGHECAQWRGAGSRKAASNRTECRRCCQSRK